jgi:CBS domain-containing protein
MDIRNPWVITVTNIASLHEVANLLREKGISGASALDELDHLVGAIS